MTRLLPSLTNYRESSSACSPSAIPDVLGPPCTDSLLRSAACTTTPVSSKQQPPGSRLNPHTAQRDTIARTLLVLLDPGTDRHDATATTGGDDDDDDVDDREVGGGLARGNARVTVDDESSRSDEEILGGRQAGWRRGGG
ncbi:Uncharacterized protein DBV15_11636 [Temnothorax longispinosus]|uniref:Uncharacterized protein n=1 Tax=Temnothorax longispinosus TaxID=300112 RepID=A0A4S2KSU4_9HYME|nr:Uncharacterized protein DBV15_11636 [Temnothorax longispinosus]